MRSLRFVAALGLGLTPLLASAAAGTIPAAAGGGADLTLTATMAGQDQRLLVGTTHLVTITVADTPGEADLRDIWVGLDDLDPHPLAVTCPAGENGHLSLEPEQSLQCTATVTAEVGYRTLVARASARVPGGGSVAKSALLHYTGFLPPPPPPPVTHAALKAPQTSEPAAARPHPALLAPAPPVTVHADPPGGEEVADPPSGGEAADPPEGSCPDGKGGSAGGATSGCCADKAGAKATSGCCADGKAGSGAASGCCASAGSGSAGGCCADSTAGSNTGTACCHSHDSTSGCVKQSLASAGAGSHKNGGLLAFTGMSGPTLATVGGIGLALMAGGALLVRRVSRR